MLLEARYGNIAAVLRGRKRLPPLTPDHVWHPGLDAQIAEISVTELAGDRPDGLRFAQAWKAAVYLWNDSLAAAHDLVQDLDTPAGSLLHGIMHRRERDYSNAKYWFQRVGAHPAYESLQRRASEWLTHIREERRLPPGPVGDALRGMAEQGAWNPYLFTDAVEIVENRIGDEQAREILEQIQQLELEAVFRYLEPRLA